MLYSAWHDLTQSCLNSNMISTSNNTLSVDFTCIQFLAIPRDIVPDVPACFPLCKAAKLLSFAVQWPWHDGRPPLPQLSGVCSAWEDGWWSNSDSFHKQAGPTSPGFPDCYETAEEGTCLDALIQTQMRWKYFVQLFVGGKPRGESCLSSLLHSILGSISPWGRIHLLKLHQQAMPHSNFF